MSLKNYRNISNILKFTLQRTRLQIFKNRSKNYLSTQETPISLPKYWSYPNQKTKTSVTNGQVSKGILFNKPNLKKYSQFISKQSSNQDKYLKTMEFNKVFDDFTQEEKNNVILFSKIYNSNVYSFEQQGLFGEQFLNGQNPYGLEKIQYNPKNQYQSRIFQSFNQKNKNQIITNGLDFGFDLVNLETEIAKPDSQFYTLNYNILRQVFKNKNEPIQHKSRFQNIVFSHIPYAIFIKAKYQDKTRFICLCAAFKYTKENQIRVLSPYLNIIPYKFWNIARMHISSIDFLDFGIRHHFGRCHMLMTKFNVPLYNFYYDHNENNQVKQFFKYAYIPFNNGLEGITLNGNAFLVAQHDPLLADASPIERKQIFQIIQKDFDTMFNLMKFAPKLIVKQNGLQKLVQKDSQIYFDIKMYEIISDFIDQTYQLFQMEKYEKQILNSIKYQIETTYTIDNLRLLLKNLLYGWIVSHSHTQADLAFTSYYKYRPGILKKALPINPSTLDLQQDQYIPGYLTQSDVIILSRGASVMDKQNFLLDGFKKRAQDARQNPALYKILIKAIKGFEEISKEVKQVNEERYKNKKFEMNWLDPNHMQSSVNV